MPPPAPSATAALATEAPTPPCSLSALARILQLETLDVGAVPSDDSGRRADIFKGTNLREGTYSPRVFGGQVGGGAVRGAYT